MPRHARERSETGIYHIMLRGVNRQVIFEENEDKQKLFETINHYKAVSGYSIYGYCFMDNHVHLLMKEVVEPISSALKKICGSYASWFNWKYQRCGHLYQERYKSEIVESDEYFLTVLRYIHQNPVRAGIIRNVSDYKWSSYNEYVEKPKIIDINFTLQMLSGDRKKALELFKEYTNQQNDDKCLEYDEKMRVSDSEVRTFLLKYGISNITELQRLEKNKRDDIIKTLKTLEGVTIRQLSRITGISKSVINRI